MGVDEKLTVRVEMNNRVAFIDFVRGLLNINPLERWSPQQAKLHPFITQQKYTAPFVPPMNLKSTSLNRSPAPGTHQQQQAEALSKQRAQAAQASASSAAQTAYANMPPAQYAQSAGHVQPQMYGANPMYPAAGGHGNMASAYAPQGGQYGQMMPPQQGMPAAPYNMQPQQQQQQSNMYQQQQQQQGGMRTNRQRASTMEQQQSGIPAAIQRVASHLDPSQPIRLQPSPAYYPPPGELGHGQGMDTTPGRARRGSRTQQQGGSRSNRDFIRNLEERTLEEGYTHQGQNTWH